MEGSCSGCGAYSSGLRRVSGGWLYCAQCAGDLMYDDDYDDEDEGEEEAGDWDDEDEDDAA